MAALIRLHHNVFAMIERSLSGWVPGLLARFAFAAVLLVYYWNSFTTKIGAGAFGFLGIADNAYYQIVPPVIEAAGYDVSNVAFFPWKIIVFAGTYSEFILPLLVVIGLFTRLAALGMIGFIIVQSIVDVTIHKIGAEATGAWFDRFSDAAILDQRLMWVTVLAYLVIKGAGALSVDALLWKRYG
jgi:putative oxidoreductase